LETRIEVAVGKAEAVVDALEQAKWQAARNNKQ
jgi:hypothetical protein